jgi:hypothetical protein
MFNHKKLNDMRIRYFAFIISLICNTVVKSQSLKETEDWIKQKFEEFEYTAKGQINSKSWLIRFTYVPDFSNKGELWITENKFSNPPGETKTTLYIIPIKYMKSIKYDYVDNCVYVLFSVKNEDKLSSKDNIRVLESNSKEFDESYLQFAIDFDNKFKDDDMPNRFKKAFDHLIELNGGSIVKDVF